ncbi:hypothetical protein LZ30DRAFT_728721 [Colletotrichum cereale]|nr:hypothetical protein LZ30DRAFT_728721 [Colletotrichum cereale]
MWRIFGFPAGRIASLQLVLLTWWSSCKLGSNVVDVCCFNKTCLCGVCLVLQIGAGSLLEKIPLVLAVNPISFDAVINDPAALCRGLGDVIVCEVRMLMKPAKRSSE